MIVPALNSAALGLADASRRFDDAAGNIAGGATDLASELVTANVLAPAAHSANAAMFRTADEMRGDLLDVIAS
jgi:hypothetical protein